MLWSSVLWAVLAGLCLAQGYKLSEEEKKTIVDLHNQMRSMVSPRASNMRGMSWGQDLETVATQYAAQCIWEHNLDIQSVFGENLYVGTGSFNLSKAVWRWFQEHEDYTYSTNECSVSKMCGHYTQLVWAESSRVGCGTHLCDEVKGLGFKGATVLVCNYSPAGNAENEHPYEVGEPCSSCPEYHSCAGSLCVLKQPETTTTWDTGTGTESPEEQTSSSLSPATTEREQTETMPAEEVPTETTENLAEDVVQEGTEEEGGTPTPTAGPWEREVRKGLPSSERPLVEGKDITDVEVVVIVTGGSAAHMPYTQVIITSLLLVFFAL
nr:PREDICTED: peptidase inhibitor 16-like [Lepisosteus oculatus]